MATLGRVVRFLLWLLVATWLGKKLFGWLAGAPAERGRMAPVEARPLFRDPWCGTHVSAEISYPLGHEAHQLHFCSAECRERYLDSQRQAARA